MWFLKCEVAGLNLGRPQISILKSSKIILAVSRKLDTHMVPKNSLFNIIKSKRTNHANPSVAVWSWTAYYIQPRLLP